MFENCITHYHFILVLSLSVFLLICHTRILQFSLWNCELYYNMSFFLPYFLTFLFHNYCISIINNSMKNLNFVRRSSYYHTIKKKDIVCLFSFDEYYLNKSSFLLHILNESYFSTYIFHIKSPFQKMIRYIRGIQTNCLCDMQPLRNQ